MAEAEPHLYAVYLGGPVGGDRMGEDHEVVLVVASDVPTAKGAAKSKWRGSGRPHVDAVRQVDAVDGYRVVLSPDGPGGDAGDLDDMNVEPYDD